MRILAALLASTIAIHAQAQWNSVSFSSNPVTYGVVTNALGYSPVAKSTLVYNVKDYGATGDGVADDYAAFATTVSALPANGGILFVPPGNFLLRSNLALPKNITVLGCGTAVNRFSSNTIPAAASLLTFTNPNSYGVTISTNAAEIHSLQLYFTNSSLPSAGALITVVTNSSSTNGQCRFVLSNVGVDGGYRGIDIQCGDGWRIHGCNIERWSGLDGIRINNVLASDYGDWSISDTVVQNHTFVVRSGIRWETSGGGRINNCKVNSFGVNGYDDGARMTNGIDIVWASGSSGIALISNCSIEGYTTAGIHSAITGGSFIEMALNNLQFGQWAIAGTPCPISLNGGIGNILSIGNIVVGGSVSGAPILLRGFTHASIGPVEWSNPGVNPVDSDNPISTVFVGSSAILSTSVSVGGLTGTSATNSWNDSGGTNWTIKVSGGVVTSLTHSP